MTKGIPCPAYKEQEELVLLVEFPLGLVLFFAVMYLSRIDRQYQAQSILKSSNFLSRLFTWLMSVSSNRLRRKLAFRLVSLESVKSWFCMLRRIACARIQYSGACCMKPVRFHLSLGHRLVASGSCSSALYPSQNDFQLLRPCRSGWTATSGTRVFRE